MTYTREELTQMILDNAKGLLEGSEMWSDDPNVTYTVVALDVDRMNRYLNGTS